RTLERKSFDFIYLWHILAFILLSLIKMKKERYGLPLYFTSSIGVGFLLSYYSEKSWDMLKKSDRFLLNLQFALLTLVSLGVPVLFFLKGYTLNIIELPYLIFVTAVFGIFFRVLLGDFFKNKISYGKKVIFYSGISMVLVSLTTIWFIEKDLRNKFEKNSKYLKNFKTESEWKNLPIYAEDFAMWDVWNVGGKIKKIENVELPEKLIYFSREEPTSGKNLPQSLRDYRILGEKNFLRASDDKENIKLYNMEKE
ncbi:MAG: ArnT family glycosyltransferase, partial [Fusobacteriaceae bacterium]